jgi:aspartyl-tRNA synthetase
METRILSVETSTKVGQTVTIKGWVNARRNMGKIVFLDIRDRAGVVQAVGVPSEMDAESVEKLKMVRPEWVLTITGIVNERGAKQQNPDMPTGKVELLIKKLVVLNTAETPPFEIDKDTKPINEELRLKYRYLDLRSERMKKNIVMRGKMINFMRAHYEKFDFIEVETPILTKGTPEGSREYIVPSRIYPNNFYVLPQSPQQFKQLLMVAGFERYFQVARCFRDEDQRGDRQPEFTQFDVEMSFASQEEIIQIFEECMILMVKQFYPNKKISKVSFPVMTYKEAMEQYGNDKPDLRVNKNDPDELAFCWVVDFPMFEKNDAGEIGATHHPFTAPNDEDVALLETNPLAARAKAYDIVLNGFEIGGGSLRIYSKEIQHKIFQILGVAEEDIQTRFGHMLEAFTFGAPPHGGMAAGLDRIIMILQNELNIREVIAFPKTGDARDPMMQAPSPLPQKSLDEVHITLKKK